MYRKLEVWKRAYSLGLDVYRITLKFPREELFGITSQMRRASTSIAANIAEGNTRKSSREFYQFISIVRGSASELETWLMYARDLKYISEKEFFDLSKRVDVIKAQLFVLQKSKIK